MTITICILLFVLGLIFGALLIPLIIYFRAMRSGWDDSNVFNVFRVICHLALHPEDFLRMRYEDGKNPFWYLTKDEFSEVVDSRPNEKQNPWTDKDEEMLKDIILCANEKKEMLDCSMEELVSWIKSFEKRIKL